MILKGASGLFVNTMRCMKQKIRLAILKDNGMSAARKICSVAVLLAECI
jgi:hypothetical protein